MAIIGFWSGSRKETGQTLSITAIATHMAVEHNYKILLIDATFDDDTMERCFWYVNNKDNKKDILKTLNKEKLDISSGAEGLLSAVASNKTTPEIVQNYTRVVFNGRLDVLCGLKTTSPEEFTKALIHYNDLVKTADKFYDMVFVDMEKTLKYNTTKLLLKESNVIVYNFTKNRKQADEYLNALNEDKEILDKKKIIPLLSNSDSDCVYNVKNITKYIGEKRDIPTIPYNSTFVRMASEAGVANYFLKNKLVTASTNDKDGIFKHSVEHACQAIIKRLEDLKYKV